MDSIGIISQLILQLLHNNSPELGARLKQQLNKSLISNGWSPLNEKVYGYKTFSDFLQSVLGDKLSITPPQGAGDIHVSLRHSQTIQNSSEISSSSKSALTKSEQSHVIRSDVWQAFTNPDPERKRFFHKEKKVIRHFLQGASSPSRDEIEQNLSQFVEIDLISGQEEKGWMRAFVGSLRLSDNQRTPFDALINQSYSSGVNAAFTRSLGDEHGESWRNYRTNKVISLIRAWSDSRTGNC